MKKLQNIHNEEKPMLIRRFIVIALILLMINSIYAKEPNRVGTTTANFLEMGFGSAGVAMGDAYVSIAEDISAAYWNPAGLAFMRNNEASFMTQPWLVDAQITFAGVGIPIRNVGTLAFSIIQMSYGDMEVNTLSQQEGTGELFDANEFAATMSYGRAIAQWFAFGVSVKYVSSQIWHVSGSAVAADLGVLIKTDFFSLTGKQDDGLKIGMSVSNYGTKLQYGGIDLLNPIDIDPDKNGNFKDVPGQFLLDEWELPLIFRVGISVKPLVLKNQNVILSIDALHPNNNSESINFGTQYALNMPAFGTFYLRGGYKALFMESSQYGLTFGGGFSMNLLRNTKINFEYAFRDIGILGNTNSYSIGVNF